MLTYAHVCSRMLTYAHVCSHMLTCVTQLQAADECMELWVQRAAPDLPGRVYGRAASHSVRPPPSHRSPPKQSDAGELHGFTTQFTCFTRTKVQILTPEQQALLNITSPDCTLTKPLRQH
jgi:hypothetical protein